jgi:uncharacterized protein YkwD
MLSVVMEAIVCLRGAKPLCLLGASQFLELSAMDHCRDMGLHGIVGHEGGDGSSVQSRIEKYCQWRGIIGENVVGDTLVTQSIITTYMSMYSIVLYYLYVTCTYSHRTAV